METPLAMNLDVAAGWLNYAGMPKVKAYHLDQTESLNLHAQACAWVQSSSREFNPTRQIFAEMGECHLENGSLVGRFLVTKLNETWSVGGYACAVSVHVAAGDVSAGSTILRTRSQVKFLAEDIGRGLSLPSSVRLRAIKSAIAKWEKLNPPDWKNPLSPPGNIRKRLIAYFLGN